MTTNLSNLNTNYSDPIQVAERSVAKREFFESLSNHNPRPIELILNGVDSLLKSTHCIKDDYYRYNELTHRGSANLEFYVMQHIKAEPLGMHSLQLASSRIVIEKNASFDIYVEGSHVRLESLSGIYAVLFDSRRRVATEINSATLELCSDERISLLVECVNPLGKYGTSNNITLSVQTKDDRHVSTGKQRRYNKQASMKKFRASYSDLDSLSGSKSAQIQFRLLWKNCREYFAKRFSS